MGSSGKKKTTMAKLARENRLRERRLDKQARKDARKQASSDQLDTQEDPLYGATAHEDIDNEAIPGSTGPQQLIGLAGEDPARDDDMSDPNGQQASVQGRTDEAVRAFRQVEHKPTDPRAKEVALDRLRDAPDEELAVFESKLQDDALEAGATEREMREAQRSHPEHGV